MIIGVTGMKGFMQQQIGKDTVCDILVSQHGFYKIGFADPLYKMVSTMLNVNIDELKRLKVSGEKTVCGRTVRDILETLGTDWGRKCVGENVWTEVAMKRIDSFGEGICVSLCDLRFNNEADAIRYRGGRVWHIKNPNAKPLPRDAHDSQKGVILKNGDLIIHNDPSQPFDHLSRRIGRAVRICMGKLDLSEIKELL